MIFVLELSVTINSPIVFGDEGFHTRLAQWIGQEKDYPAWYPFAGTKLVRSGFFRPPLWNILEGSFYFLFGFNDIIVKVLTPFIGSILIGLVIFILVKRVFSKEVGLITSIIAVTIPSLVTYSLLFYTDILFTLYFSLFIFTFIFAIKTENKRYWILAGVFSALTILTKNPGVIIVPFSMILFFLYQVHMEGFSKKLKNYFILIILLILISGPFFLRNLVYYGTPNCALPLFNAKGCQKTFEYENIKEFTGGVVGGGSSESILKIGVIDYFGFTYGNIWFVQFIPFVFFFLCGFFYLVWRKKRTDILILLALVSFLPIYYVSLTGRIEDLSRATLSLVPIIAFISGTYFNEIHKHISRINFIWLGALVFLIIDLLLIYYNYAEISWVLSTIFGVSLFAVSTYFLLRKNYQNALIITFLSFIILSSFVNFLSKTTDIVQVKGFAPSFFEACSFIKQNTTDDALILTIWDYATTYNCQRGVYQLSGMPDSGDIVLSGDVDLVLTRLKAHDATHIFIQKFSINPIHYPPEFVRFLEDNPKSFKKIYETGPDLDTCLSQGGCDGAIVYQVN